MLIKATVDLKQCKFSSRAPHNRPLLTTGGLQAWLIGWLQAGGRLRRPCPQSSHLPTFLPRYPLLARPRPRGLRSRAVPTIHLPMFVRATANPPPQWQVQTDKAPRRLPCLSVCSRRQQSVVTRLDWFVGSVSDLILSVVLYRYLFGIMERIIHFKKIVLGYQHGYHVLISASVAVSVAPV
jgi:hypothetical protein